MALYFIDTNGLRNLSPDHFVKYDTSIAHGRPSFEQRIGITADCMRETFFFNNHDYDYLLQSGAWFAIVTHPEVTFTCQNKIELYNKTGCGLDGRMGNGQLWTLSDTIKAIYFWDKSIEEKARELRERIKNNKEFKVGYDPKIDQDPKLPKIDYSKYPIDHEKVERHVQAFIDNFPHDNMPTGRYHIGIIPGQPTSTQIDQDNSFKLICSQLGISVGNRIRLYPTEEQLVFGSGLEGSLSPLPPFSAMNEIEFMYFDGNHLAKYGSSDLVSKLDDLSVTMMVPCPPGQFIERRIGIGDIEKSRGTLGQLAQFLGKFDERGRPIKVPLEVIVENGRNVAYITGPLFGDYRDSTRTGDDLVLRFGYVPTHMLSVVMNHRTMFEMLKEAFNQQKQPGVSIVQSVDMKYKFPRIKK